MKQPYGGDRAMGHDLCDACQACNEAFYKMKSLGLDFIFLQAGNSQMSTKGPGNPYNAQLSAYLTNAVTPCRRRILRGRIRTNTIPSDHAEVREH